MRVRAKLTAMPMAVVQPAPSLILLIAMGAGIGMIAGAAILLAGLVG
jgi:hypothetical protein